MTPSKHLSKVLRLYHYYPDYHDPVPVPPVGTIALCGHVRSEDDARADDGGRSMRQVDERSCMKCVRMRLGDVADDFTDDELRDELGVIENESKR